MGFAVALEGLLASEQPVERDAQGPEVCAAIDLAPLELLGREVAELALDLTGLGQVLALGCLRDAEVDDLHQTAVSYEQILRRDVAVHDSERLAGAGPGELVGVMQAGGGVRDEAGGQPGCERPSLATCEVGYFSKVAALDVLHGHEVAAGFGLFAELEDGHHVRVVDQRRHPRLVQEHAHELRLFGEVRENALDDHDFPEALRTVLAREVHLGHPAVRDLREQRVASELLGCERRGRAAPRKRGLARHSVPVPRVAVEREVLAADLGGVVGRREAMDEAGEELEGSALLDRRWQAGILRDVDQEGREIFRR